MILVIIWVTFMYILYYIHDDFFKSYGKLVLTQIIIIYKNTIIIIKN